MGEKESGKMGEPGQGCMQHTLGNYDLQLQIESNSNERRESSGVGNGGGFFSDSHIKTSYFARHTHTHMQARVHANKCACEFHFSMCMCVSVCVLPTRQRKLSRCCCCSCTKGLQYAHTQQQTERHTYTIAWLSEERALALESRVGPEEQHIKSVNLACRRPKKFRYSWRHSGCTTRECILCRPSFISNNFGDAIH